MMTRVFSLIFFIGVTMYMNPLYLFYKIRFGSIMTSKTHIYGNILKNKNILNLVNHYCVQILIVVRIINKW